MNTPIQPSPRPSVLSIAGSDSCGGAGLQADLKTFTALGVDGATVVTAVTAQNSRGVRAVQVMSTGMVSAQLDAVFDELDIRAVKLGMLADAGIVATVADHLGRRRPAFVLVDPVMIASSGARLLSEAAVACLRTRLLPLADCLTPNLHEAAILLGTACAASEAQMIEQGHALLALGPRAVVMKGGHATLDEAIDILVTPTATRRYAAPWIATEKLHGTGCTLGSAITALVARGIALESAVARAKGHVGVRFAR